MGAGLENDVKKQKNEDGKDGKKDKKEEKPMVPFFDLFKFSDGKDRALQIIGAFFAIIQGGLMPSFAILFGEMLNVFFTTDFSNDGSGTTDDDVAATPSFTLPEGFEQGTRAEFEEEVEFWCLLFVYLGLGAFVCGYIQSTCWAIHGHRQSNRIRSIFFNGVMRQDIGWLDGKQSGALATHIAGDIPKIQEGLGDKVGQFIVFTSTALAGFVIAFTAGWKLSLVLLSLTPLLVIAGGAMGKVITSVSTRMQAAYGEAGGVAEEVLGSVRTVASLGREEEELQRYAQGLQEGKQIQKKIGFATGLSLGATFLIMFGSYALAFWYGAKLVAAGEMEVGNVITVFFGMIMGSMAFGQANPNLQAFNEARGAAYVVFGMLENEKHIDPLSEEGDKLNDGYKATIEFNDIKFTYPTRPDTQVLKGLNLTLEEGTTTVIK